MTDLRTIALEELAKAQREVERWKAVLAGLGDEVVIDDTDLDFDPTNLISVGQAAQRAVVTKETIRRWCREYGIGIPRGGTRWDVSAPRLRRHLGLPHV